MPTATRDRFVDLHTDGLFVIPNPFDAGSARLLESAGAKAVATTSSGFAATRGRGDDDTPRADLVEHVRLLTAAVQIPVSVDAQCCFPRDDGGIDRTVDLMAEAGAAGLSIEDYDPAAGGILPLDEARRRVAEAVAAAKRHGLVVTARAENILHGRTDFEDTIARLTAYRDEGAHVLYAPGLTDEREIARVVALGLPVNVLAVPSVPPISRLRELGVRRVSTGGALTWAAYETFRQSASALLDEDSTAYLSRGLSAAERQIFEG